MISFSFWRTSRLKMFHIVRRREKSPWSLGSSCYFQRDPSFRCHYPSNVFLGWMEVAWLHDRVSLRWRESKWSMSKYAQLYKTFTNKIEHTCACSLAFDVICPIYILFQPAIQRYIHPSTHIFYTSHQEAGMRLVYGHVTHTGQLAFWRYLHSKENIWFLHINF